MTHQLDCGFCLGERFNPECPCHGDGIADTGDGIRREWINLSCKTCGHWRKGPFSKNDIAAWCRIHKFPGMHDSTPGVVTESVCPTPCGVDLSAPDRIVQRIIARAHEIEESSGAPGER